MLCHKEFKRCWIEANNDAVEWKIAKYSIGSCIIAVIYCMKGIKMPPVVLVDKCYSQK